MVFQIKAVATGADGGHGHLLLFTPTNQLMGLCQALYLCAAEQAKGVKAGLLLRKGLNLRIGNVLVAMYQQPKAPQQKVQRPRAPAQVSNTEDCNDEEASREQRDGRDQRFHGLSLAAFFARGHAVQAGAQCRYQGGHVSVWCAAPPRQAAPVFVGMGVVIGAKRCGCAT